MMLPPPRADHVRYHFAREQINSFQRYVQSAVPFVFGEFDNVFADGDTGAVTEDIDLAGSFGDGSRAPLAIGYTADVALQEKNLASLLLNFSGGRSSFVFVDVEDGDEGSHFSQA